MALMKYPSTNAQLDFQKNPAAVLAASPKGVQNSITNKMSLPASLTGALATLT
jgi:hypothetical protein